MSYMDRAIKEEHHIVVREALFHLMTAAWLLINIGGHEFAVEAIDELEHSLNDSADEIEAMWEAYGDKE
jgi:hypothetical protein